jgi:pyruvate dehydrogenase E2 component (dihydrolipoamide acetyltransferase)
MTVDFKLPDIGEGVAEGEIVRWIVNEGDAITEDDPMVEVMTDKATVEITSPVTGSVAKILVEEGAVVPVHSVIIQLEASDDAAVPAPAPSPSPAPAAPAPASSAPAPASSAPAPAASAPAPAAPASVNSGGKILAAPATRKLARESGIELAAVTGSGPRGRVTKADVEAYLQAGPAASGAAPAFQPRTFAPGGTDVIPYRGIRKATGDQMVRAMYTAPHFTYVDEIDMTQLYALRKEAAAMGAEKGVKVTFLPFIIKALCSGIRRHPSVNAELKEDEGNIVVKHDIHVGIAADTDNGLMVPVVKHADKLGMIEVAAEIQRLTEAARTGKASRDELTGSTITITSAGSIGGLFATPIINYPEVAILGVYQIKDKPVIRDGNVVPGKIGYLSITLDHRCVDGATAGHLMNHMKRLLENPGLLALEA